MPELPEVQTIVAGLGPRLVGRRIDSVTILWAGSIARPASKVSLREKVSSGSPIAAKSFGLPGAKESTAEEFVRQLVGEQIESVWRRGKYVVMDLASGQRLVVHLRMTGRLMLREEGAAEDRFTRVVLDLDNGQQLRLADARKFARMSVIAPESFAHLDASLGPEPLGEDFTLEKLKAILERRRTRIKNVLLDQRRLVGLGNIYADEALFEAGIHPERPADSLSPEEVERLLNAIKDVLASGVADRGTTFDSYLDGFGQPGGHQHHLRVYRRGGEPCLRCGTPIERIVIAGRGTHYCPRCQKFTPRPASKIAPLLRTAQRSPG